MNDASPNRSSRKIYTQATSLLGIVTKVEPDADNPGFVVRCRSGDEFCIRVSVETWFTVLKNTDDLDRDRVPNPQDYDGGKPVDRLRKYVRDGDLLAVEGVVINSRRRDPFRRTQGDAARNSARPFPVRGHCCPAIN